MKQWGGIIFIFGLILGIMGFREGVAGLKAPVDLYALDTNVSEIGYFDMVTADIYEVYGSYATRTTTENGRKTAEDSYYLIPAYEGDDVRYIGIKVNEKEYDLFGKMYDDTWDYYDGYIFDLTTHVEKTGCLKKMNKKMQEYYYGTLRDAEWFESDAEMKEYALPYYLDPLSSPKTMVPFLFISVALMAVGAVLFVIGFKSENVKINKAAAQTYVMINGVSYAKSTLAHVNQCVLGQEKIFAAQELAQITGMSMEEASVIIENWSQYYY